LYHPDEWVPLVFGGHQPPLGENSPELRVVKTIFNRYNEVPDILADRPQAYRPIFMVDDDGSIVVRDWALGFALGIELRAKEWGKSILLTEHRQVLAPILVYCEGELDLLPDMPATKKRRRQATAHSDIAQAVAAARAICNPHRRRGPSATGQTRPRQPHAPVAGTRCPAAGQAAPPVLAAHRLRQSSTNWRKTWRKALRWHCQLKPPWYALRVGRATARVGELLC
jgi:yecA family protein